MKETAHTRPLWILRGTLFLGPLIFVCIGLLPIAKKNRIVKTVPAGHEAGTVAINPKSNQTQQAPEPDALKPETCDVMSTRAPAATAWVEGLAKWNSNQAISWALTESDIDRRTELIQAVLRGWASVDSDAAARWARNQSYAEHGQAMSAVFNGATKSPEKAIQLAQRLTNEDPAHAEDYGSYLIFSLGTSGEFLRAAIFAADSPAKMQTQLLTAAYNRWARQEPESAARAALSLQDPLKQKAAFQAALSGWAEADPEQLTQAAVKFPEGEDRKLALVSGLRSWIEKNPEAAANWISRNKFTPEMEAALEE